MKMTINDAKCCLEDGYDVCSASCKYFSTGDPNCKDNVVKFAIDIMNKYQKIAKILKDDAYYEEYGNNAEKFIISAISEVLEDGKSNY